MRIIDKESISGKIIRALGAGVGISIALANRRTSYKMTKVLVKEIFGLNKKPNNLPRYFYKLRQQKLIDIKRVDNQDVLCLTENGEKVLLRFNYEKMQVKNPKVWDRQFRLVIFDIPETKKKARDSLREKIKELGFVRFNDSVWAYPYSCQKEIDFIANYWGVGKYVHFAIVKNITKRESLERYFRL